VKLAVCAEMMFTDLPLLERIERIHQRGFEVEIWNWTTKDIDALISTGATFSSMTGYVSGSLTYDQDELLKTAEQSVEVARRLNCPRLNLHGGALDDRGLPVVPQYELTGSMWLAAEKTLARLAQLGEDNDVMFVLENLNTEVDHPGVPFGKAKDVLALVKAVDHPNLRMMLDLYHAQIGEGNLIALLEKARSRMFPAAANRARARSTIRPSPRRCGSSAMTARSLSRPLHKATATWRCVGSGPRSQTKRSDQIPPLTRRWAPDAPRCAHEHRPGQR
jgi:hydroxypyruvate isomerase